MLHSLVRAHRAQLHKLVSSAHTTLPMCGAAVASAASHCPPVRCFAAAAKKGGKKAAAAAATTESPLTNSTLGDSTTQYDDFNRIPSQPKASPDELAQSCLTEEQLRFSKRPMPSSEHRHEVLPTLYLGEKPIADHTASDLGKYYTVGADVLASMPPNVHRTMSQEYMGGGPYHMVRSPGFEIVQALKQIEAGGESAKSVKQRVFGVRGESGCGKSAALHYATQFAREQTKRNPSKPWLLVATRADEFSTETKGFIAPSAVKEGIYDQALYTMEFFTNLLKTESPALKLIALKRTRLYGDIVWPEGQTGTTLFDLVSLASTDREQAPRLLYDFTAELKRATEVPVLVVLDNLNVWDQVCEFIEPYTYQHLDPRKLALVDAFSWFTTKPPGNGASVWALTTRHATLNSAHRHFQYRDVNGLDSWWYSAAELKNCVVHYSVSEFILSDVDQDLISRINGLTGKVPRDVFKQAFLR